MSMPESTFSQASGNQERLPAGSRPYTSVMGPTGDSSSPRVPLPQPQPPGTIGAAAASSPVAHTQAYMDSGERVLLPWGVPAASGAVAAAAWDHKSALQSKQQQREALFHAASTFKEAEAPFGAPLVQASLPLTTDGPAVGPPPVPAEGEGGPRQWPTPVPQPHWVGGTTGPNTTAAAAAASVPSTLSIPETQPQQQQRPLLQQQQAQPHHPFLAGDGLHGVHPGAPGLSGAPGVLGTAEGLGVPSAAVTYGATERKWQARWAQGSQCGSDSAAASHIGPPLADGSKMGEEGPLNSVPTNPEYMHAVISEGAHHNNPSFHLAAESSHLQLPRTGPMVFMPAAEDLNFAGGPLEQQKAKKRPEGHGEIPTQRWISGTPGVSGASGLKSEPGPAAKVGCAVKGQARLAAAASQQLQLQEVQQLSEAMGTARMGAFQRLGAPSLIGDGQQQAEYGMYKSFGPNGGTLVSPWPGLPAAQKLVKGSAGGPPQGGLCVAGAAASLPRGPGSVSSSTRGSALPSSSQLGAPQGPPDCLLSAVASQQYALLAVRAFLLACDVPVAPPWKQIALWGPWLSGQQRGPPHVGSQCPQPRGDPKQPEGDAGLTECEEPAQAVEDEPVGCPPEEDTPEASEEAHVGVAPGQATEQAPVKQERKRKRVGGFQGSGAAAKKASRSQRSAAIDGVLMTAQDLYKGDLLLSCASPPLPLTALQQADLCLELITALGRLRPQWRRQGNRVPYQLHVARLRPSLLFPTTPPKATVLESYRTALGPLVAHIAELPYVHLAPGEAEEVVEEVEMLKGSAAIDSVLDALDAMGPWGHQDGSQLQRDSEAMEAEAMRDTGDRRQQLLVQQQQQQQLEQLQAQQQQQLQQQQQQIDAARISEVQGPAETDVILAYNPDLKALRQLNYLVPGTRVYIHADALEVKLAEMGLPPLPPPPAGGGEGSLSAPKGPLSKFVMVEAGERYFTLPYGEYLPLKLVSPPHHVLQFSIGQVVQLLQEGRLCLLRFTEREALKRRLPLLGAPAGPPNDPTAGGGGGSVGYKTQRGTKPACCPAPPGIEKICRCKCNHRRQELYAQLKQRLRIDKKGCLAAIKDCLDLNHVAFALPSARTYQLEILSYLFGVDPWFYAKNRHEAPSQAEIPNIIRRYKELTTTKEYEQSFKSWLEEQAREKCLQQEITADITAIGLNLKDGDGGCVTASANPAQQDPRVQASIAQLVPNTPICVRIKALLGLPSGNEQHLRGVVRRAQMLPRGRAISISVNNRKEEFVLLPEELETLVAHDDLRLVRMRSRQWFAYEAQATGVSGASEVQWPSSTQDDNWKADAQP
ncbi:hypothetical protein, conserved [Eimeria tenella]|uniref:Uncharacterized protein n=1 Tax=Eimeria tenella TaxID=5802 RepID=U6L399_EIMTE|nr:hypothetical protein, conserved [Eimeria tenella]CDJ43079.1 hypothetical protein, conserved [Eimeria tenella]|eukprot:XP_013233829.1 hypothetical protein, conserved [Eimeria tenella]